MLSVGVFLRDPRPYLGDIGNHYGMARSTSAIEDRTRHPLSTNFEGRAAQSLVGPIFHSDRFFFYFLLHKEIIAFVKIFNFGFLVDLQTLNSCEFLESDCVIFLSVINPHYIKMSLIYRTEK